RPQPARIRLLSQPCEPVTASIPAGVGGTMPAGGAGGDCKRHPAEADRAAARALCLSTALARSCLTAVPLTLPGRSGGLNSNQTVVSRRFAAQVRSWCTTAG